MNDLTAILPQPGAQTDVTGSTARAGRKGGNSDFSSEFKRAGERRGDDSARPKRDEPKPAEELAAYASAQQNTYRARQSEKSDDSADAVQDVTETAAEQSVQSVAEQIEDTAEAAVIEMVDDTQTFAQVLADFDPGAAAAAGELDVTAFLAEMISETDEQLGNFAQAVHYAQDDAGRTRRAGRGDIQQEAQAPAEVEVDPVIVEETPREAPAVAETVTEQETEIVENPEYAAIAEKITSTEHEAGGENRGGRRVRHDAFLQRHRERMAADEVRHGHHHRRTPSVEEPVIIEPEPIGEPVGGTPVGGVTEPEPVVEMPRIGAYTPPSSGQPVSGASKPAVKDTYTNPFAYMGIKDSQVMGYDPATRTMPIQVVNQIVEAIRLAVADGRTTMEIQLNPESLGKVSILLTHSQDGLTAQIRVPDDRVDNMLNVGLGDLTNSLKDLGINLKNIEITRSDLAWDFARGDLNSNDDQQQRGYQSGGRRGSHAHRGHHIEGLSGVLHHDLLRLASMLYGSQAGETSVEFNA